MSNLAGPIDINQKQGLEIRIAQAAVKIWRGGAVGIVSGTGYCTPLRIATAAMMFIGVSLETSDNTLGTPGTFTYGAPTTGYSPFLRVAREGIFSFAQTGTAITQTHANLPVYFADDQTVTLTPGAVFAGQIATVDESGLVWVDIGNAVFAQQQLPWQVLSGSADAIPPNLSASFIVNGAPGVDAMTLAAPTALIDDGKTLLFSSGSANAHTITAAGLLETGTASVNLATFAAQKGAGVTLRAYNAKWQVLAAVGITFS